MTGSVLHSVHSKVAYQEPSLSWLCFALFTSTPAGPVPVDLGFCTVCDGSSCSVPETPIFRVLRWMGRVSQRVVVLIPYRRMSGAGSVAGSCVCG